MSNQMLKPPCPGNEACKTCELRCECGNLIARRVGDRIELKCRRCKRVIGLAVLVETVRHPSCG